MNVKTILDDYANLSGLHKKAELYRENCHLANYNISKLLLGQRPRFCYLTKQTQARLGFHPNPHQPRHLMKMLSKIIPVSYPGGFLWPHPHTQNHSLWLKSKTVRPIKGIYFAHYTYYASITMIDFWIKKSCYVFHNLEFYLVGLGTKFLCLKPNVMKSLIRCDTKIAKIIMLL